jgi:hypothetical protein
MSGNDEVSDRQQEGIARFVLQTALASFSSYYYGELAKPELAEAGQPRDPGAIGRAAGGQWIRGLHDAFLAKYPKERYSVLSGDRRSSGLTEPWGRYEFLHDIAVLEVDKTSAAYRQGIDIPRVRKCLWQVESEVVLDGTGVGLDVGKLVAGSAVSKLLIAAAPSERRDRQKWVKFVEELVKYLDGNFFLGLIPTYSNKDGLPRLWKEGEACVDFYVLRNGVLEREAPILRE